MPIYEYQCKKCKHKFERIQKFSDPIIKKCPECGGSVERLLSAPAVQFKGSGWYVTDYARKGASGDAGSSESASSDGSKSSESSESKKTDSKSESKTDSKSETKSTSKSKKEK